MGVINLLSSEVYNRISAGEVVERPASIIKELVENSIDAGALNIKIEILDGGISSIIVSDDGCGMEKDDLINCIKAHATSKIKTVADMDNIGTLGFRGEALASIASVTKLTISSKTERVSTGNKLYTEGGEEVTIQKRGMKTGTIVECKNLFFNVPAREKFLKSIKTEESEVTNMVAKFILANPEIKFTYYVNKSLVYQSFGDGFESAMTQVFGVKVINDCFHINVEKNGILLSGYISKHHFTKGNRSSQYTFLNKRIISNSTISSAISNAYAPYLMKGRFPFYALRIFMPNEIIDVNVHPNKSDVRFSNNQIIYSSIFSAISKVLDGSSEAISLVIDEKKLDNIMPVIAQTRIDNADKKVKYPKEPVKPFTLKAYLYDSGVASTQTTFTNDDIFLENKKFLEELEKDKSLKKVDNFQLSEVQNTNFTENIKPISINEATSYAKIIGQAFETYLIVEIFDELYIIDQHATHERLLYDKLVESIKNRQSSTQTLLIPYILSVSAKEYEFINSKLNTLSEMGFDISEFGLNSFNISGIPTLLSNLNLDNFFKDLLSELNTYKNLELSELIIDKIAQTACKHAIKSGDKLNEEQIKLILKQLNGNFGLKCPHGRPAIVKFSRKEIDKWFKRIL